MNRSERRKQSREDSKSRKLMWPSGYIEIPVDDALLKSGIRDGDVITIAGLKRNESGEIITDCKPGEETKFKARILA